MIQLERDIRIAHYAEHFSAGSAGVQQKCDTSTNEPRRQYLARWRALNRERLREYQHAWRAANPDRVKIHREREYENRKKKRRRLRLRREAQRRRRAAQREAALKFSGMWRREMGDSQGAHFARNSHQPPLFSDSRWE